MESEIRLFLFDDVLVDMARTLYPAIFFSFYRGRVIFCCSHRLCPFVRTRHIFLRLSFIALEL